MLVFGLQVLIIILCIYLQIIKNQSNSNLKRDKSSSFKEDKCNDVLYDDNGDKINKKPRKQKNPIIRSLLLNILITTTIMILAVDFKVFPRRNAKIEHFGLGLMDAGAICFLGINAMISLEVRLLNQNNLNKLQILKKNVKPCLILLMLGLMRLCTIKNINYQEHVSEYGVHMNFFIVLALVKLIGLSLSLIFNKAALDPLFGFLFICLHEVLLTKFDLSSYIQYDGHRETFLDKNKESLCTLLAYIGFYLSCYNIIRFPYDTVERSADSLKNKKDETDLNHKLMIRSLKYAAVYLALYVLSNLFSEQISRRNMNMAFTCLSLSIIYLATFLEYLWANLLIKYYSVRDTKLILQDSYTNNGLIVFLFANILTGLVNLGTNTIEVADKNAVILLFTYSFVVSISICFLDTLNNLI